MKVVAAVGVSAAAFAPGGGGGVGIAYIAVLLYSLPRLGANMKPVHWMGASLTDLRDFPAEVQDDIGYALYEAQTGAKSSKAKPLKGFGGAGVLEIVETHDGDAYRAVYTVRFAAAIYVLHVFQKKSKRGIATPKHDMDLIEKRLQLAIADASGDGS